MTRDLSAYSFEAYTVEECKQYCRDGYVIVERIPYVCGVDLSMIWHPWIRPRKGLRYLCLGLLSFNWSWEYNHKCGSIVFDPQLEQKERA